MDMAPVASDLSALRVLLIEEDFFARELEKTALQHLSIRRITITQDGTDALNTLESGASFDLIMLDGNLCLPDGSKLTELIRKNWPKTSILVLTNNDEPNTIKEVGDFRAGTYLIKPFSLEKLRDALELVLNTEPKEETATLLVEKSDEDPELEDVTNLIQQAITFSDSSPDSASITQETIKESHQLAQKLSEQLNFLIETLDTVDTRQLRVIQLHVKSLKAALSCRQELFEHETQNLIVDGLNLASDLVTISEPT
jgi:two-component system, chemotaxis family, chemotaxis protein CheY